jgi:predicted PurR-regulated permease PerM
MINRDAERIFFLSLVCAITVAFFWLVHDFLQPIFWAVALGIVVYPLHTWIERRLAPRASLAAIVSVAAVVLVVVLPLLGVAAAVTGEAAGLYTRLNAGDIGLNGLYERATTTVPQLGAWLERLGIDATGLEAQLSNAAIDASRFIASRALAIGQDTVRVLAFFFLMLYLLFFFLRDGQTLLDGLVNALPLGDERERRSRARWWSAPCRGRSGASRSRSSASALRCSGARSWLCSASCPRSAPRSYGSPQPSCCWRAASRSRASR